MISLNSVLVLLGILGCMDCIDAYMKRAFLAKSISFAEIIFGVYTKTYEHVYLFNSCSAMCEGVKLISTCM